MATPRWAPLVTVATLFVLPFVVHGQARPSAGDSVTRKPITLVSSKGDSTMVELGSFLVPESHSRPAGRRIRLKFVRFASTAAHPAAPIVYLAGGPGGSGIQAAQGSRFPLFMALRSVADVIALDQRAIGISEPNLSCGRRVEFPLDRALPRQEKIAGWASASRACADSLRRLGFDLASYNVNESADDLDDLRRALGAPKITLWAISYGTTLALTAIRRHERGIDRAILAGLEDTDGMLKLPSSVQSIFDRADSIARRDTLVSRSLPSLASVAAKVLDSLDRRPVVAHVRDGAGTVVDVTLGKYDFQDVLWEFTSTGDVYFLPALLYAASRGEFGFAAKIVRENRSGTVGNAASLLIDCASGAEPARVARIRREAAASLLGEAPNDIFPEVCASWGGADLGSAFRTPVSSSIPVLFISGTMDARTPPSQAAAAARGFPNSTQLVIDAVVHSDPLFDGSPRILEAMLEFLRTGKTATTRIIVPFTFGPVGGLLGR